MRIISDSDVPIIRTDVEIPAIREKLVHMIREVSHEHVTQLFKDREAIISKAIDAAIEKHAPAIIEHVVKEELGATIRSVVREEQVYERMLKVSQNMTNTVLKDLEKKFGEST